MESRLEKEVKTGKGKRMGVDLSVGRNFIYKKKRYLIIFSEITIKQYNYNHPRLNKLDCKPKKGLPYKK